MSSIRLRNMINNSTSDTLSPSAYLNLGPWGATANNFTELLRNREIMSSAATHNNRSKNITKQQNQNQTPTQAKQQHNNTMAPNKKAKTQAQGQTQAQVETASNGSATSRQNSPANMLPPRKKNPLNFSNPNALMVDILVSPQEHLFRLHKSAITHWSPFFRSAFNTPSTIEFETKVMKLPAVDVKVFGLFSNYLYTQEIEHGDDKQPELMELARLWTCAAEWKVPSLQNKAVDMLVPLMEEEKVGGGAYKGSVLEEFVNHAYATAEGDLELKKLAALKVMVCASQKRDPIREWAKEYPEGMVMDLAEVLMDHIAGLTKAQRVPKFIAAAYQVPDED